MSIQVGNDPSLSFKMTFDGEALAHHEMDVMELAPALLNLNPPSCSRSW